MRLNLLYTETKAQNYLLPMFSILVKA